MSLSRRTIWKFLGSVFGLEAISKAQHSRTQTVHTYDLNPTLPPAKDQCPVCETFAKPYVDNSTCLGAGKIIGGTVQFPETPCGPPEKIIRCETCSVAFWQDRQTGRNSRE
jgi:uncharacterized protein with PIN domain